MSFFLSVSGGFTTSVVVSVHSENGLLRMHSTIDIGDPNWGAWYAVDRNEFVLVVCTERSEITLALRRFLREQWTIRVALDDHGWVTRLRRAGMDDYRHEYYQNEHSDSNNDRKIDRGFI